MAILRIYADLEEAIQSRRPRCEVSGKCCRFDEFGHRLYVTTAELGVFARELGLWFAKNAPLPAQARPIALRQFTPNPDGCIFQRDGLCGVHAIRPFGCRIFFCDPLAQDWVNQTYEGFHSQIKAMHERLGVPYFYVEWRQALAVMQEHRPARPSGPSVLCDVTDQ